MQYNFETIESESANVHDHVLTFGKYKGSTLGELASEWEGRNYLSYLITTSIDQNVIKNVIKFRIRHKI